MSSPHIINIAKDFSRVPLGRFRDDSPYNGTTFREDFLIPALSQHATLEINLDGTEGYGSSFLEEAFGGLVRLSGFDQQELLSRIHFVSSEDPTLIDEIREYIEEATPADNNVVRPRF